MLLNQSQLSHSTSLLPLLKALPKDRLQKMKKWKATRHLMKMKNAQPGCRQKPNPKQEEVVPQVEEDVVTAEADQHLNAGQPVEADNAVQVVDDNTGIAGVITHY